MKKKVSKKKSVKKRVIKTENVCDRVCENRVLCWVPRILGILFVAFISLFALDAFGGDGSFGEQLLGFIIHLVPSFVLVIFLVIAWKHEKVGGWLYILLGVVFTIFFDTYEELITFLLISGPVFLTGVLFLISAMRNSKK